MDTLVRKVRFVGALIGASGLAAVAVAVFAEELGLGASPGTFGTRRLGLLAVGAIGIALGALLLMRPGMISGWISRSRRIAADLPLSAASRRWVVAGTLVALLALVSVITVPRLIDRLIAAGDANDAPPPEAAELLPPEPPSPSDRFRAAVTATCERHQGRVHTIAKRSYAVAMRDRPRLLRAHASAISELEVDLRRLDPPPEDADAHSRLLHSLRGVAAAYREAATAVAEGDAERERSSIDRAHATADLSDTVAGAELGAPVCGY